MSNLTPADRARATCRAYLTAPVDPGRTPNSVLRLARVMPDWLAEEIVQVAPDLAVHVDRIAKRLATMSRAVAALNRAEAAFARDLGVWIDDDPAPARPGPLRGARRGECPVCGRDYALNVDGCCPALKMPTNQALKVPIPFRMNRTHSS